MANEMVLLPKAQYASLLDKKCEKCDKCSPTKDANSSHASNAEQNQVGIHVREEPDTKSGNVPGNHLSCPFNQSSARRVEPSPSINGDAITEQTARGYTKDNDTDGGLDKLNQISGDSSNNAPSSELHQINSPSKFHMENPILLKFKGNDQRYIRSIIEASEKRPDIISWDSDGVVTIKGNKIEGSSIFELLSDTLTDRKNPVGKFFFYTALGEIGVTSKSFKNRNNKAFFNAVTGRKIVKKSDKQKLKKEEEGEDRKVQSENDQEKYNINNIAPARTYSPPPKKHKWMSWK